MPVVVPQVFPIMFEKRLKNSEYLKISIIFTLLFFSRKIKVDSGCPDSWYTGLSQIDGFVTFKY